MKRSAPPSPQSAEPAARGTLLRLLPLVVLALGAGAAWWSGLPQQISLSRLAARHAELQALVSAHPVATVAAYVGLFAALTGACLPVALVLSLVSGLLFGPVVGGSATVVGGAAGALLTYGAARTAAGPWLRARAERSPRLRRVMEGFGDNAFAYILTLRFIPVAPFAGVNIAAGLVAAPVKPFVLATLIAGCVTSFLYASLGAGLGQSLGDAATVKAALERPALLWPLVGLAVLAILPVAAKRLRGRVRRRAGP